jgi:ATP-dependent Clp protease ATP-binding subunit ClpA
MVELALPRQLHAIGQRAIGEALARRAATVEAEHVLLAILNHADGAASKALARAGLDHAILEAALTAERERSLTAAGIGPNSPLALVATPRTAKPGWGASVRDLLRRADKPAAKDDRPGALEIELATAILRAELGTVPRALAIAKVDRLSAIRELQRD